MSLEKVSSAEISRITVAACDPIERKSMLTVLKYTLGLCATSFALTVGLVFVDIGCGQNLNFDSLVATYYVAPFAIFSLFFCVLCLFALKFATWLIERDATGKWEELARPRSCHTPGCKCPK